MIINVLPEPYLEMQTLSFDGICVGCVCVYVRGRGWWCWCWWGDVYVRGRGWGWLEGVGVVGWGGVVGRGGVGMGGGWKGVGVALVQLITIRRIVRVIFYWNGNPTTGMPTQHILPGTHDNPIAQHTQQSRLLYVVSQIHTVKSLI